MLEIELKAWTEDLDLVRARLEALGRKLAKSGRVVVKEDVYYGPAGADPRALDWRRDRLVRVRRTESGAVLTAKRKEIASGVETSEEIEVGVDDPDAAARFLDYLGYRPFIAKKKETRAYAWSEEITVELNRVEGLGYFVEVEALVPESATPVEVEAARGRVRSVLSELGIAADRIEPRPYMDLLRR